MIVARALKRVNKSEHYSGYIELGMFIKWNWEYTHKNRRMARNLLFLKFPDLDIFEIAEDKTIQTQRGSISIKELTES